MEGRLCAKSMVGISTHPRGGIGRKGGGVNWGKWCKIDGRYKHPPKRDWDRLQELGGVPVVLGGGGRPDGRPSRRGGIGRNGGGVK